MVQDVSYVVSRIKNFTEQELTSQISTFSSTVTAFVCFIPDSSFCQIIFTFVTHHYPQM